ncbi:hypothetical protein Goarm_017068 [Gossypium armourianum]|uniref:DUF4283 domain-containing protein n=1 Tax=Gossypium armourianum TaxID=34283 RepID=A0A7J9JEZ2_9ROSI|nr:hypothetical protein [Gossypium armourianum]
MRCDQSGIEEQVMVMEDTETPKGLEEKPNERLYFKDILVGSLKSLGKVVQGSEKNDLQLLKSDVSIGTEDGLLSIRFSEWVHQKPSTPVSIMDLENDYFLVKFQEEVDYVRALTEGPWTVFGQYLTAFMCNAGLEQEEQNGEGVQSSVVIGELSLTNRDVESENFGPWMLVDRQSKRTD